MIITACYLTLCWTIFGPRTLCLTPSVSWVWQYFQLCSLAFTVTISPHLWEIWDKMLDHILDLHHQNTRWGNIFWRAVFQPFLYSSQTRGINTNEHCSCSGGSNTALTHCCFFPLMSKFPIYLITNVHSFAWLKVEYSMYSNATKY